MRFHFEVLQDAERTAHSRARPGSFTEAGAQSSAPRASSKTNCLSTIHTCAKHGLVRARCCPTIAALLGHAPPITCTANISDSNDIAQERLVRLERGKLTVKFPGQPPPLIVAWMDRFFQHESSVLTATRSRTRAAMLTALKLDPLMRCDKV